MKQEVPDSNKRKAALDRAKKYLIDHLADETLTVDHVTGAHAISVRTLSRLSAETGVTPMGWLHTQRLGRAFSMLAEWRTTSVTEAAFSCGFSDLSNFSCAFKRAFGRSRNSVLAAKSG
ncbi:helix-turn-helix transcriptional regulator [Rhizobium sp. Root708]|uniref:helix-turn-helix transcriptional regulator n=1 Tax=Rhizobium sp. Root708 TaxID=1736592 RepID=UPI00138F3FC6|nr:AraC family transcriptional regulator [Rhizobium sp. Root708]